MIQRFGVTALVLMVCFGLAGCGSEQEKIKADMEDVTDDMADILEDIKTKADVDKAKPKLEKIGSRIKELAQRSDKLSAEDKKKLEADIRTGTKETKSRVEKEMQRISQTLGFDSMIAIVEAMKIDDMKGGPF